MKSNFIILIITLLSFAANGQQTDRRLLSGRVVSDSVEVENITVRNLTGNLMAITNAKGDFMIYARPADTLRFDGIAVRERKLVLSEAHFSKYTLVVELDENVKVLDEAVVTGLTGNLAVDSRKLQEENFTPKLENTEILDPNDSANYQFVQPNNALPQTESQLQGIDFKRIYQLFFPKKGKKK